jgi:hypothetical protein
MEQAISINGKELPIDFSLSTIAKWARDEGISMKNLSSAFEDMDFLTAFNLIHWGLKEGGRKAKQEYILTLDQTMDVLGKDMEAFEGAMQKVTGALPAVTKASEKK